MSWLCKKQLDDTEAELMQDERFKQFIELQRSVNDQAAKVWKNVETQMINNNIKSIKGDWGTLTIAECLDWNIDADALPAKFIKKVPDKKKISDTFRIEGKAPKGCEPYTSKYLTKRLK